MQIPTKIKRVLLILPPLRIIKNSTRMTFSPLGISYIASYIRDHVDVKILDAAIEGFNNETDIDKEFVRIGLSNEDIQQRITEYQPDIVGISCIFSSMFPLVRDICKITKKIDPSIITITGGTYPSFETEHCLKEPALDMICIGEGEHTFLTIIEHLNQGKSVQSIDGIAYKENNAIHINPKTKYIENLDSIPFPARDLLPMHLYEKHAISHNLTHSNHKNSPILTSRGCPARCIYCSSATYWGNTYRTRSVKNVLDEIGELIEKWGIGEIQFEDDNITLIKDRAREIFQGIIDRGYNIKFNFPNGIAIWTLDEELIDLMIRAGCDEITLAFDSGSQHVLDSIIKKPLQLTQAEHITRYMQSKGLRTNAYYIVGFPGETLEEIKQTFKFAHRMNTSMAYFFIANPLPGSHMHTICKEQGLLCDDFNFENLSFSTSAFKQDVYPKKQLEKMVTREFFKYIVYSHFRNPIFMFKKFFINLFCKRPKHTFSLAYRLLKRIV